MTAQRLVAALCVFGIVASTAAEVAAAPAAAERDVSDGVDRPIHDYSGEGDASSMELNPALLSAIRGLDLALLGYNARSPYVRGSGFGAFIAANLRFGVAFGFGAQFVQPRLGRGIVDAAATRNPSATKLTWAFSGGIGDKGSFGVAISGIRNGGDWLRRPDLDLGVLYRLRSYGSLGIAAHLGPGDLRDPTYASVASLVGELGVRPFGTRILELAAGVRTVLARAEPGGDLERTRGASGIYPRGRMALRYHGVALLGEIEQVQTTVLDPASFQPLRGKKALRGSVALELAWDFVRARGGVHAGISDGVDGFGFAAHASSSRHDRVFWPRHIDAERIDIDEVDDERELIELLVRLDRARRAGDRSVLVVESRNAKIGWASLHEIREALIAVRNAGGHVFAYLEAADTKDYYVASAAERVYVHPAGSLAVYGLASVHFYFKRALDKLGVGAEVVRVGEYKAAGEMFSESAPSKASKAQDTAILADHYAQIIGDIARARGISPKAARAAFDDAPHTPQASVAAKLADEVVFRDQLLERVSDALGAEVEFRSFPDTGHAQPRWGGTPYVGVVLVEGTIIDGRSRVIPILGTRFAGGDTIAETLRKLRRDPLCKGIVLRVNSPGGSALASDVIWREVALVREGHERDPKFSPPIVVSMGDVAASGGYYVAMGAKHVFADPMTITGSIGVIAIHFDLSGLLQKLGIDVTTFRQGKSAGFETPWQPYTPDQRTRVEWAIAATYDLFTQRVADGRGLPRERVDELGRGHVYSGTSARRVGLVDGLGNLDDAIAKLRVEAGIAPRTQLELRVLPDDVRLIDLVLDAVGVPRRGAQAATGRRARRRQGLLERTGIAVDLALARLPTSLLFLAPDQPQALWLDPPD